MAEEAMVEAMEEAIAEEVTAEEIMAEVMATSAATAATDGATRVDMGMAVIPSITVTRDMADIGDIPGIAVIPAIMGTVDIMAITTTTTVHGSQLARAS